MIDLSELSTPNLLLATKSAYANESVAARKTIAHIFEVNRRKAYLPKYASLFDYLVNDLKMCKASASLRMNAVKLMNEVPEARERVASGEIHMTAAANVRTFLAQEKRENREYSKSETLELVEFCEGKSVDEVRHELVKRNPQVFERDVVKQTSDDRVRVTHNSNNELEKKLARIKEIWSHVDPYMSREEMLTRMAEIVLDKIDPVRKAKRSEIRRAKNPVHLGELKRFKKVTRYIPAKTRHALNLKHDGKGCEHVDPESNRRCGSNFQLEIDHIKPWSMGGTHDEQNLRQLCAMHNRWRTD